MEVITYEIQQQVKVRKYNVDCKKLCNLLRTHKKLTGLNNKRIAELLNVSITKVEHWFRKDKCFSIPDEDVWLSLKQILNIATNDFDLAITTFEEKDNVFEKGNRIYDSQGICPTITCLDSLVVLDRSDEMEVKVIGQMDNTIDHTFESANRVYDKNGLSPTINCCGGGGLQPKIIDDTYANREPRVYEDYSPALRSEREGLKTIEQDICRICAVDEQNMNLRHETFGTLTTDGSSPKHNNRVMEYGDTQYRIRKLTPKECWRLMDFTDEDFEKAAQVNSNTQLYKQAGNSIIRNVLVAILGQMIPGKEDVYKKLETR